MQLYCFLYNKITIMKHAFIYLLFSLPFWVHAQHVRLVSSSSTDWSGGVAGHAGTRYTFTLAFDGVDKRELIVETIWIGNKPTPLVVKANNRADFNTVLSEGKKAITCTINAAVDRSFHVSGPDPYAVDHKKQNSAKPPLKYKGVALLEYHYKGTKGYFVINKITTKNPSISYP